MGEQIVASRLAELESEGWRVLHDVHWPGRPKANLDHVVIGPGGVVVIDTKNWSGDVELRDGELRRNGYRANRINSVLDQAGAVAALLEPQHRHLATGWICLVGQPELAGHSSSGIRIEGTETLLAALRSMPTVLAKETVEVVEQYLAQLLAGDRSPGLWTTRDLEDSTNGASQVPHSRRASANNIARANRPARVTARRSTPVRPVTRRQRKKQMGIAGTVIRLSLLVIGLMTLLNVFTGLSERQEQLPAEIPSPVPIQPRSP